jgi:hypothetical protein
MEAKIKTAATRQLCVVFDTKLFVDERQESWEAFASPCSGRPRISVIPDTV